VITFKQFIQENEIVERFHELLHHIAEEELIACKVLDIVADDEYIDIIADCQDVPRKEGPQPDLTKKLLTRLQLHPLQQLHKLSVTVVHRNVDEFEKLGEGWKDWAVGAAITGAVIGGAGTGAKKDQEGMRTIDGVQHYHAPFATKNKGMLPANVERTAVDGRPAYKWTQRSGKATMNFWTFIPQDDIE